MSGPVQVTLTFSTIAIAIAQLSKLDDSGTTVTIAAAAGNDAPAPKAGKSTAAKSSSAAPAEAASSATTKATAATPAAAPPPAATATSASGGTDFYTANFLPQKLAVLCSPSVNERTKVVELLAKFGAKKGNEIKADDMPAFLLGVNELLVSSTNATTATTALLEGVGGVKVPAEHIPSPPEDLT